MHEKPLFSMEVFQSIRNGLKEMSQTHTPFEMVSSVVLESRMENKDVNEVKKRRKKIYTTQSLRIRIM